MKKELYEEYFKNKKVTVMGLGLLGRGLGDTAFLVDSGAKLIVTDKKTEEELAPSLEFLRVHIGEPYVDIQFVLGEHRLEDFVERDFILKAAGIPFDSEYINCAVQNGVPVYMSAALVSSIVMEKLEGVTIIGITGTRGKSTVTQLIAHILKTSGLNVHVGGNVRGIANLPLLETIGRGLNTTGNNVVSPDHHEDGSGDFLVLELDSWQLQGFGDMHISPHIAVFTSFMDDHMNYYKNDKEMYFNDKANIYHAQNEYDVLIASPQAASEILMREKVAILVPEQRNFEMKLIGEHNVVAARLAYEVATQCGLEDAEIRKAIATFSAVEGRLEDLGLFGDKRVRVFNDNNATTPEATIAALTAIKETYHKNPILIIGGADKGLPLEMLVETVKNTTKACVFLEGTGTARLEMLQGKRFATLSACVEEAFLLAEDDDIILFSPAFASFSNEFNNEYEKNDAFIKKVESFT